ncbi:ribonuclease [Mesorhizobium sp. CAU 1741]|uniref:ribonuclease T2 family protein n=1 Tax=Mesorhizobium sp. CAU 1741 TaxID=3140366 RepID=UPI00325BE765
MIPRSIATIAAGLLLAACQPGPAGSSDAAEASGFDFYVLSLSWSPTYCEAEGEDANRQQCDARQPHGFVVHGLWPQFEQGWPEFCDSSEPERVPNDLVGTMLGLMPSAGLIGHQWRKHGSCTGFTQADYFSVVREARETIAIPARFQTLPDRLTIDPDDAEAAFLDANPGLPADGIAVSCRDRFLSEVRICMTKDLDFRSCAEVDARSCSIPDATMPAMNR